MSAGEEIHDNRTPWVSVKVNLPRHRKTLKLARLLDISRPEAVGILVELFCETYLNEWRTGDWKNWDPTDLEMRLGWNGKPGELIKALKESGFLDGMVVHDWLTTQSRIISKRFQSEEFNRSRKHHSGPPAGDASDPAAKAKRLREAA